MGGQDRAHDVEPTANLGKFRFADRGDGGHCARMRRRGDIVVNHRRAGCANR